MTAPADAAERVHAAIEQIVGRVPSYDALAHVKQLVADLELACVRHVAAARESATVAERERCATVLERCGRWSLAELIREAK